MKIAIFASINFFCIGLKFSNRFVCWFKIFAENFVIICNELNPLNRMCLCHRVFNLTYCYTISAFNFFYNRNMLFCCCVSCIFNYLFQTAKVFT